MSLADLQVTKFEGFEILFPRPLKMMENGCVAFAVFKSGRSKKKNGESQFEIIRYEQFSRKGIVYREEVWISSRLSYHLNVYEIPRNPEIADQGWVLHTCDNKWCINPKHLYIGSAAQNWKDTLERHPNINEKMGKPKRGRKFTIEHRRNMSKSMKGLKWSEESKKRASERRKGLKMSDETRSRMSKAHKILWAIRKENYHGA